MTHKFFIQNAIKEGKLSPCRKNKVGAIITKNKVIISKGHNASLILDKHLYDPETLYLTNFCAEKNAIIDSKQNLEGSSIYVTLSPCLSCSALIIKVGIKYVYYLNEYKDTRGIELLRNSGVIVRKCIYPELSNLKPNNLNKK